ncbi:MAG TPA: hypothetical protein VE912_01065 [Bacteroidales bacterium]|nr:hypothetical protein [Bacteroidales bacterium]
MNKLILTLAITFGMIAITANYTYAGQKDKKDKTKSSLVKKLNTLVQKDAEDLLHLENWMKEVEIFSIDEVVEEDALKVEYWMIESGQFANNNEEKIALEAWMLGEKFTGSPLNAIENELDIKVEKWMFKF